MGDDDQGGDLQLPAEQHRQAWDLIPWVVNGTAGFAK